MALYTGVCVDRRVWRRRATRRAGSVVALIDVRVLVRVCVHSHTPHAASECGGGARRGLGAVAVRRGECESLCVRA
jgi:hypothetical protein